MSLRDRHEQFMAYSIESRDHYGQDVTFNLSGAGLEWFRTAGNVVAPFVLGGVVNIVSEHSDMPGNTTGVSTQRANATVRLSSLLTACGGIPAAGLRVTVTMPTGTRTYLVQDGQTHVDEQLGRVHYYLTDLAVVA